MPRTHDEDGFPALASMLIPSAVVLYAIIQVLIVMSAR
jgi:hypothetical protein